jgi:hypothetical protein
MIESTLMTVYSRSYLSMDRFEFLRGYSKTQKVIFIITTKGEMKKH